MQRHRDVGTRQKPTSDLAQPCPPRPQPDPVRYAMRPYLTSHVCFGSRLCENAKVLERDRRSYSSKTVLALKLASAFNSEDELKNVILVVFRSFAFLHSQGPTADIIRSPRRHGQRSVSASGQELGSQSPLPASALAPKA